jgi:hypothetical protein
MKISPSHPIGQRWNGEGSQAGKEKNPSQGGDMGMSICDHPAQVGSKTDTCKYHSNDACPSIKRDSYVRGQDPSCDDLYDKHREAGEEDNGVSFDHFLPHVESPLIL